MERGKYQNTLIFMYIPKHFVENRIEVLHDLIDANQLATLVTMTADGLTANHIPLLLSANPAPFGTLQGHVARANRVWRDFTPEIETLVVFQSADAYINPAWYATKQATGKVVPTWDYAVVHARGFLRVVDDAVWLRAQIENLTAKMEAGSAEPWRPSDAPADYIEKLIAAIVGIEIVIIKLEGKWKVSQNQPPENIAGVTNGLRERNKTNDLKMAELVGERGIGDES